MKIIIFLLCCVLLVNSHIYSAKPKITYNIEGRPLIYHLYMSLQTGLGANDYLHLIWPQVIHSSLDKSSIKVKLITFSNNLQVSSTSITPDASTSDSNYYITFNYEMQSNSWYEIQIYPTQNPTIPSNKLVQVILKSSINVDAIVYDSNLAFGFINVEKDLATLGIGVNTMGLITSSSSSQINAPAAIYTVDIDITPTISQSKGGNFTLELYYDSGQPTHTSSTMNLKDFSFIGLCQSKSAATGQTAAVLNYCQISADLSTIIFSLNSVVANKKIRISTQVKNPLYKSVRGIRGYWVQFVSGIVQQNKKLVSAVSVNTININNLGNDRIYLLWGIQPNHYTTDPTIPQIPLFKAQNPSSAIYPYNSFNIGFSFSYSSPIEGRYRVKITLQAQGVLQGSLVHNFPAYEQQEVYCHYQVNQIYCQNVGAFINTNFRYFISGKAYFNSNTSPSLTTFGDISIIPVVYYNGIELSGTLLYDNLSPGSSIPVRVGHSYFNLPGDGTKGYHANNHLKIGNAQVVTMKDDKTLSSTANAMKQFFTGTNNTIGIVPDLGSSQQLVFLLQTQNSHIDDGLGNDYKNDYTIKILYNNKVISFQDQDNSNKRGLDFVGYHNQSGEYSISYSPCHQIGGIVCEKYNADNPIKNTQVRVNQNSNRNFYGMYTFTCGGAYSTGETCGGSCVNKCNMFRGWSNQDLGSSVMAMRKVVFKQNYYSSLYADQNLLDFVIMFYQGTNLISAGLINAYTVVGSKMVNIKASYVNYFDYSATSYNKGTRIPMMLRIGGGILPKQSRNATIIGVFFDDNIEAQTFYTKKDLSYQIGCSTNNCLYYPNKNINLARNDNWLLNKRVQFHDIPSLQIQFNLLVPVTPNPINQDVPKTLYIGFFSSQYSIDNVTGLLKTLSIYRLYGSSVCESIIGSIGAINSLTRTNSLASANGDLSSPTLTSGELTYALNVSNIVLSPGNNTFVKGYSRTGLTYGTYYGAGITITSLYYNIFASSTLAFETPPANTASTCVIFGYVYNEQVSGNMFRDKQSIYTAFCPIDSTFDLTSSAGNINFINPQYPNVFTNGFPLQSVLTYGYSDEKGNLLDYKHETQSISLLQRTCVTSKMNQYMPQTDGKQRSIFNIITPQIRMKSDGYDGYPRFRVQLSLPSTTILGTTEFSMLPECQTSDPLLSCSTFTPVSPSTYQKYFDITYLGTQLYIVSSFSLSLYARVNNTFGTAANYIITIYLPQNTNGIMTPFGHPTLSTAYDTKTTYCTCQSTFTIGTSGRGTSMIFNNVKFQSDMQSVRSYVMFDFGASSYRDTFFSSSYFVFNFGYIMNTASTFNTRGDFKCLVYENNNDRLILSRVWSKLTLGNLASVTLIPKYQISTPSSIKYTMKCQGTSVPPSGGATMTLGWKDFSNGEQDTVQTATGITAGNSLSSSGVQTFTLQMPYKRFRTQGFKSFYTFKLTLPVNIDQNSRIYFNFHSKILTRLDKQSIPQCYTRLNLNIIDSQSKYTYCQFISQRQLSIWNNQNILLGGILYIDIYNIQQPKLSDISVNQKISVTIDIDDNYVNGVNAYQEINDNVLLINNNLVNKITILDVTVDQSYIRTLQTLVINIKIDNAGQFTTAGKSIYLELPASYAEWIKRSDIVTTANGDCYFEATGTGVNLATACTYISKRILKITLSSDAGLYYTFRLKKLKSPSFLPVGKDNQYRFNMFLTTSNSQTDISYYTFADYSQVLTLFRDSSLVDLSWKYYQISQSSEIINLNSLQSQQAITIYTGYYSSLVQLRQSTYPTNFQLSMLLSLTNYANTDFLTPSGSFQIQLGKSTAYFRIAARSNLEPGFHSLQFTKQGDIDNQYTEIPPLNLVVNNKKCSLMTQANMYMIPMGGYSLPIIIKGINCIPIEYIQIGLTLNSGEVTVESDVSSLKLDKNVLDGTLYIVLKHTIGTLPANSMITGTFTISGPNSAQYSTIPGITITLIDPSSYQILPVATALSAPSLSSNKATFKLQCNQASTLYWGLGIYPSILNSQALDFQARIISTSLGLSSNFTQEDDYYKRVYGIISVNTMQVLSKTIYNLKSKTNYIFKYFCKNQMGLISDSQTINFTSLNYGAYLMKVSITFRNYINYDQYHDLTCSLAENFKISYTRLMTQTMTICNNKQYVFYNNDSSVISNIADSSGYYTYNFYILPDYNIANDNTNVDVRNSLSLHSFSNIIITSTEDYLSLPQMVQIQTEDIQVFSTPVISINQPIAGLNSVILTASITNMNGFVIIGIMNGIFNFSTMTLPTTNNIKKGLFQTSTPLVASKMLYTTQNFNVTFEFSSLLDNTEYTMFYFATSEDPTFLATSSQVKTVGVRTLEALTVNINWEKMAGWTMGLLILVMVGIL